MPEIDLKKTMAELIQQNPEIGRVLREMGIECSDCIASQVDTLPDVVRMYNLDLNKLLARLQPPEEKAPPRENLS